MILFVLKLKHIYVSKSDQSLHHVLFYPTVLTMWRSTLQSVTCTYTCIILLKVKVTPSLVSAGEGRASLHVQHKTTAVPVESTPLKREHRSLRGHMQPSVWDTFSFFLVLPRYSFHLILQLLADYLSFPSHTPSTTASSSSLIDLSTLLC